MSKHLHKFLVTSLLAVLVAQVILSIRTQSPTTDELAHHVATGYSYVRTGNFKMNPITPPLSRSLTALPLLFLHAKIPLDHPSWKSGNAPEFAKQFFYIYNHNADELIFWARIPILFLSILFGLSIFYFANQLFGPTASIVSLILYVFCPDILAHSGLATSDLCVAFFFFLTLMSFGLYLKKPSTLLILITGFWAGLAFLSKFSAILLFPILLLVALFSQKQSLIHPKKMGLFLAATVLTIWAGYLFEVKPLLKDTPNPEKKIALLYHVGGPKLVKFASETPIPLSTFVGAFASMLHTRSQPYHSFLMGQWSYDGKWYYYLIAFFIKNTLPFLILGLLGIFFIKKISSDPIHRSLLLIPIFFFFLFMLRDKAQAGIRYFLPIYPCFIIVAGGFISWIWHKNMFSKIVVTALLLWHATAALAIHPHPLAYFNELVGGPKNGYKYLRDSNLDWGQDLKGLAHYIKEKKYDEIALLYPWPADPHYYGIRYYEPSEAEYLVPKKKIYAISAQVIDSIQWSHIYKPITTIGYSIFVYDLRTIK